ncbi:MAG: hypothetical protein ABIO98_13365 [Chitinophagales bacterium]
MIILIACFFLQSCSTGYEASRFSHLKYVKKDATVKNDDSYSASKTDLQKIKGNSPTALESTGGDYAASIEKPQAQKLARKIKPEKSMADAAAAPDELSDVQKLSFASGIGQATASVMDKLSDLKSLSPAPITDDQDKLLLLWLILLGASIVFGVLYSVSSAFGILATLAGIAAVVFFILWIVAIAKS